MKKLVLPIVLLLVTALQASAQRKPNDPKHENHYLVNPIDNDDLKIEFKNAHSQQEFALVEMKVTNKTADYIYCKGNEAGFIYDHGTFHPKGSLLSKVNFSVEPMQSQSKTLKVAGDSRFHSDKLKLELNCFYKVSAKGKIIPAPDFQLPASKNSFDAGDCKCTLEKSKQITKETAAQFKCVYNGKNVMFVDPSKLSVKLRDGQEFANNNRKDKGDILMPGDDITFTAIFNIPGKIADMQFTVLSINWNDTFTESTMVPIPQGSAEFVLDEAATLLHNK